MIMRDETPADHDAIAAVTIAAFRDHPFSRQTEHPIAETLRDTGALSLSLVAEDDGAVVGHAAFSPLTVRDGTAGWCGVGPLSVRPDCQRQGIRRALMGKGLRRLRLAGVGGCMLVGDPAYYARFGFRAAPALHFEGVPPEVFLVLSFGPTVPRGRVIFHPAFQVST